MIDTHCHLDFDVFDNQRDDLINKARESGVHTIINIGCDLVSSQSSVELAEKYRDCFAAVGVHPHDAKTLDDRTYDALWELTEHKKVKAIGEIGLDFYRDLSPRQVQANAFVRQLELAAEVGLPVVIHSRESLKETTAIIKDFVSDIKGVLFHCFPGNTDEALELIEIGCMISVGGIITFKNANMAQVAAEVDLEHLVLETDAPFLTPAPFRGKRNEPSYVKYVYEKLADLKSMPVNLVEKQIDRNAQKFFNLVETFGD